MPELTLHSTPTPDPLPPSLYTTPPDDSLEPPGSPAIFQSGVQVAAVPPVLDPAAWEEFPVFRETFLMYITPPGYAAALRKVGEMLFTMILESYDPWPGWPESSTRTELRAAVADLRHLEGFLAALGREHVVSSLTREDERLSRFAARQVAVVARIARRIEEELVRWTTGEES
jgi:hypothetical protein